MLKKMFPVYRFFFCFVFFSFSQLFVVSEHFLDVVSPLQVKDEHTWEKNTPGFLVVNCIQFFFFSPVRGDCD